MPYQRIFITVIAALLVVAAGYFIFTQTIELGLREPSSSSDAPINVGVRTESESKYLGLPLVYEENWNAPGVSQILWKSWGQPRPIQAPDLGRNETGALNPNGDKNYHSGLISRFVLDLSDGAVIEFWAIGTTTTKAWQNVGVGLSRGLAEDFYGIEQVPNALLNTFVGVEENTNQVQYRLGTEQETEPFEPLNGEWSHYRTVIHPDGSVEFYRDDELRFKPESKLDMTLYSQVPVLIDGLSWRTDVLIDDLAIYGTIVLPELLTVESASPLLADGIVLMRPQSPTQDQPSYVKTGDLDGDGWLDAVVLTRGTGNEIQVLKNPGSLTQPWQSFQAGKLRTLLIAHELADFDGDGDLDLVTGSSIEEDFEVKLWENDGTPFDGPWRVHNVAKNDEEVISLLPIDVDGDGDLDLVTGTHQEADVELLLYENTGEGLDGPWPATELGAADDGIYELEAADFDADGDLDIATGGRRDDDFDINVWENDGTPFDGRWSDIKVGPSDGDVGAMQVVDLDGDNLPDIITGSSGEQAYEVRAWRNSGTPFENFWQEQNIGVTDVAATDVEALDIDGDGKLEVVSASRLRNEAPELIVWSATGEPFNGGWTGAPLALTDEIIVDLEVADIDNDGDEDLITVSPSAMVVWENVAGE